MSVRQGSRVASRFLMRGRVVATFLARQAMEFATPEALKEYLKQHPNADKSRHTVKKPEAEKKAPEKTDEKPSSDSPTKHLFQEKEVSALPDVPFQKTTDPEKLFAQTGESHEYQLDWLNHGKGLDKAIGAQVVRGDKGEKPDFSKPGPVIMIGPVKKRARVDEKVQAEYGGDYSRIVDLVRASVAVDSMDQLSNVIDKLKKSGMKLARKPKDRFAKPTEAGYRDLSLNVEYPNGHVGELQLHVKAFLEAKDAGHKYYEKTRTISANAKKEGRTTMTEEETREVEEANNKQRELYDAAWNRALRKEKTAAMRVATATKFYEYDGMPAYWTRGNFPKLVTRKGERVVYDLQKFFREAATLSEREFQDLKHDASVPEAKRGA